MSDLRLYQPSFTAGELSPALAARVDLAKYSTGLKKAVNVFVHPHGGVSNRAGLEYIATVKNPSQANSVRLVRFQFSTEQTYILEFGNKYMRVFRDGGAVLASAGGAVFELVTPYLASEVHDLVFAQEADVVYLTHVNHPLSKLGRTADNAWTLAAVTFKPKIAAPTPAPVASIPTGYDTKGKTGYKATNYQYKVACIADSGEESLPSDASNVVVNDLSIQGGMNRVTWTAVSGAVRYLVYKEDNGIYGYIGGTTALTFDDQNIVADLADAPQAAKNPFNAARKYPRVCAFIEQRLALAATLDDPQAVWMSQSANYENFSASSPAKASDSISFRIRARQVNEIRSIIAVKGMMILTSGSEWLVTGGSNSDAITPSAINMKNQGYRGAARVQPLVVGNTVLFPQRQGGVVRDFSYSFEDDSYVGKDLTVLARHLFFGREIVAWDYAQAPWSIVWCVLSDGSLVSLTYMKEQDVWAWTQHDSHGGKFEDVTVIAEGGEDVPYFVVAREINGVTKRFIERLHDRNFSDIKDAFFVDCGLTYRGPAVKEISGLSHLTGEKVAVLADGNVVNDVEVVAGKITLKVAASTVHVGLGYTAMIQTLDLDMGQVQGLGSVQGRMKTVSEVTLRVEDTRGIWISVKDVPRENDWIFEHKERQDEAWGDPITLSSEDIRLTPPWDWNTHGTLIVKQFDPLPFTILALMPDVTVGR